MLIQSKKQVRVAVYLRVSTDDQAAEGHYGLPVQEEKIKKYCELYEYTFSDKHIYRDEGVSGALPAEERPELKRLWENAKKKEFDMVIVYRVDRLSRNLRILLNFLHELEKINISFCSATEAFDTSTPQGKSYLNMIGTFAQLERDTIKERTMNGRINAAKDGKWVVGLPPYGYKVNKETKLLEIIPEEASVVKEFFEWLVNEHLSLAEIQRRVNDLQHPAPKFRIYKKTTLNFWHKRTVGRILTNEIYSGITIYRKYKRPFKNLTSLLDKNLQRPEEDQIIIKVPPIISPELFVSAIEQLSRNREFARRNQKRDYLFSKIIYCGHCGFKMFGGYQPSKLKERGKAGTKYYHGVYRKPDHPGTTRRCPKCMQYCESRLEPIWDALKETLKNPKNIFTPLEEYKTNKVDTNSIDDKIKMLKKQSEAIKNKKDKLTRLYLEDNDFQESEYKKYLKDYENQDKNINNEMLKFSQSLLSKQDKLNMEQSIKLMYNKIRKELDNVSYEEKIRITRLFIDKVMLYAKENVAEVIFRIPFKPLAPVVANNVLQDNLLGKCPTKTTSSLFFQDNLP